MTDIVLNGLAADRDRMLRLCSAVAKLGYQCRVELWGDVSGIASKTSCEETYNEAEAPALVEIICWTTASVGTEGNTLQSHAVILKEEQRYLGLLLDEVSPPSAVTGAQDISLHDWDAATDAAALEPLHAALAEKFSSHLDNRDERSATSLLLAQLKLFNWLSLKAQMKALARRVRRMHALLKAVGVLGTLTFMLAAFGFLGGVEGNAKNICRFGWVASACRALDIGDLPSQSELADWARAERGSSCEAIEQYRRLYGAQAEFADEAQLRLAQSQSAFGEQTLQLERSVAFSPSDRKASRAAAIQAMMARAASETVSFCRMAAQNFEGEARPGIFSVAGEPDCISDGERFDCRANGTAKCTFIVADMNRTCPPLSTRSNR